MITHVDWYFHTKLTLGDHVDTVLVTGLLPVEPPQPVSDDGFTIDLDLCDVELREDGKNGPVRGMISFGDAVYTTPVP